MLKLTRTACAVLVIALAAHIAAAETVNVEITGTVGVNELIRGPFQDATKGDPFCITYTADVSEDFGFGDIHV